MVSVRLLLLASASLFTSAFASPVTQHEGLVKRNEATFSAALGVVTGSAKVFVTTTQFTTPLIPQFYFNGNSAQLTTVTKGVEKANKEAPATPVANSASASAKYSAFVNALIPALNNLVKNRDAFNFIPVFAPDPVSTIYDKLMLLSVSTTELEGILGDIVGEDYADTVAAVALRLSDALAAVIAAFGPPEED